jgi:hypothetical protein
MVNRKGEPQEIKPVLIATALLENMSVPKAGFH